MLTNVNTSFHPLESDQVSLTINPLAMISISATVIEPIDELQGFLTVMGLVNSVMSTSS